MRIFVSEVGELFAAGADKSELARALLAYAVREQWGRELPAIEKRGDGKPFFPGTEAMHFSLSHSKSHVLAAVSPYPLGADIEELRPLRGDYERLFSPGMLEDFGFFGGWTLREAVFKLRGEGSLRTMDIRRREGEIVTPYPGVRCALYGLEGCVAAAATAEDSLPEAPEIIESGLFWPKRA